jgi:hypothetical protein
MKNQLKLKSLAGDLRISATTLSLLNETQLASDHWSISKTTTTNVNVRTVTNLVISL